MALHSWRFDSKHSRKYLLTTGVPHHYARLRMEEREREKIIVVINVHKAI